MILVDERVGSRELLQRLRSYGADADLAGRISADFQFEGHGPDGPVLCGLERKTIGDLLTSMRYKRLAGSQIPHMCRVYDIRYLVIEGYWRRGRDSGLVETRNGVWKAARGNFRYSEVARFLASLREFGGVHIWRTADEEETSAYIAEEWHWWSKDWSEHRTAQTMYIPDVSKPARGHKPVFRGPASVLEKWLASLPGIDSRAAELAQYFVSPRDMANAEPERWLAIRGIGRKTIQAVEEAIENASTV